MQTDTRAAMPATIRFRAKPRYDVGTPVMRRIAQHDEIAARWGLVATEIDAAPGIDVDVAVSRDDDMACVADTVREDRRAKTRKERQPALVSVRCGHARRGRARARAASPALA